MKVFLRKYFMIVLLFLNLLLFTGNTMGYVLNCPGVTYYGTYQTFTFSSCVNSSYLEVGPSYFWLSDMNFTVESLSGSSISYNLSYFNDKDYSELVIADLRAAKPLDLDFCVKEFITNIELLVPHAWSWATEIIYAILKAPEFDACLDKYYNLADKDIFFDLLAMMDEGYYGQKHARRIQELREKLK